MARRIRKRRRKRTRKRYRGGGWFGDKLKQIKNMGGNLWTRWRQKKSTDKET